MKRLYIYADEYRSRKDIYTSTVRVYNADYIRLVHEMKAAEPTYKSASYLEYWMKDKGYNVKFKDVGTLNACLEFYDDKEYLTFVLKHL